MTPPYTTPAVSNPTWGPLYRSKGESAVAQALNRLGIRYVYEPRLELIEADAHGQTIYARPDFMLSIEHPLVIEYAGMLDQPDYLIRHQSKAELYASNGVSLIELMPEDLCKPDWEQSLLEQIIHACTDNHKYL